MAKKCFQVLGRDLLLKSVISETVKSSNDYQFGNLYNAFIYITDSKQSSKEREVSYVIINPAYDLELDEGDIM